MRSTPTVYGKLGKKVRKRAPADVNMDTPNTPH
jgi:hypothetical protein